jgi:hypothetical protein
MLRKRLVRRTKCSAPDDDDTAATFDVVSLMAAVSGRDEMRAKLAGGDLTTSWCRDAAYR